MEHRIVRRERERLVKLAKEIQKQQADSMYPREFIMPVGIQYELTGKCNLRCKHCYNRSGDNDVATKMMPEDWLRLSKELVADGGIFQCILSGGEPLLLGDSLIPIMDVLHNDGTAFLLISNGLLMTEAWIKKLRKYSFFWIQISIDDCRRESHDEFRGHVGSWDAAVKAAFGISSAGLPLVIAHTVTPENLPLLPDMVELAYKLGASTVMCGETMLSGRAAQNRYLLLNDEERLLLYDTIEKLQKEYLGRIAVRYSVPEEVYLSSRHSTPNKSVIVRPDGNVRLDCTAPFVIGNVQEESFLEIWTKRGINAWKQDKIQEYIRHLSDASMLANPVNHVIADYRLY